MTTDRKFARDVAKQLDRRQLRRRLLLWLVLLAVVAFAALYLRFGGAGLGLGGGGGGGEQAAQPLTGKLRCVLRLSSTGIQLDGKPVERDQAVAACKSIGAAELVVTGDARHSDKPALLSALRAAAVTDIVVREPSGSN